MIMFDDGGGLALPIRLEKRPIAEAVQISLLQKWIFQTYSINITVLHENNTIHSG